MFFTNAFAQKNNYGSKILSGSQVKDIFTDQIRKKLRIEYSIFRVYHYFDKSGEYYLVLTEREYKKDNGKVFNDSIKGFNIKIQGDTFVKIWNLNDFIIKQKETENYESSIWFWTKILSLKDIDEDGLIEPIIIYGTSGLNGTDDGRIKILIYYKGEKRAIRHQNGILDFERNTQVDKQYYNLPFEIQQYVLFQMESIVKKNLAIFPRGYKEKMKSKIIFFDEK